VVGGLLFAPKEMKKTKFKDTDKLMLSMCGYALDVAKEFGIELDYSGASIKKVEKIIE